MARRILGPLDGFEESRPSETQVDGELKEIGIYQSAGGDTIGITSQGLAVPKRRVCLLFRSVRAVDMPEKAPTAGTLRVQLDDDTVVPLLILGGDNKFRDVYEFGRFVMRAAKAWRGQFP